MSTDAAPLKFTEKLGYAMFLSPDLSATGKLIYAYATYTLMMLAYTAINLLGAGNEETGFRLTMMIFAVISILLFWACFATTM